MFWPRVLATGALLGCGMLIQAHQQPTTLMLLDIGSERVRMHLHLPLAELELAFGHGVTNAPETNLAVWEPGFRRYLTQHIEPLSDGKPWRVKIRSVSVERAEQKQSGPFQELLVSLELTPPEGASPRNFLLRYDAILHQVVTHKVLVSVRNDWQTGATAAPPPLEVSVIQVDTETGQIRPLRVQLDAGSRWAGFRRMLVLGMQHIREGMDHLLFLIALLLPVSLVARGGRWAGCGALRNGTYKIFGVVTAFSIGHSFTMMLGAMEWLSLPRQLVEVLIAVSILVSAIHAIRPLFPASEALVAGGFGLLHGLGFASGLMELQFDPDAMAVSTLGFLIGIEAMQVLAVALVLPWLLLLNRTAVGNWFRMSAGTILASVAVGCIYHRLSGDSTAIERWFAHAPQMSIYTIPGLALLAIPAFLFSPCATIETNHESREI